MMGKGYIGKVLIVDLSEGKIKEEQIPDHIYEKILSGVGLAAWILNRDIPINADPLGPDNVLGFVSGLLTDTGALMTGRWIVAGKSPLTGGWGDANSGGDFSPAIKKAGYDGIFIRGISEKPVYLKVVDGKAELVDASHLWGLDTVETEERIKEENNRNVRVACIGPAGENLSLISGIVNNGSRVAARSGLGAVMGSKKLKAVVVTGSTKSGVYDHETIVGLSKEYAKWIKSGDRIGKLLPPGIAYFIAKLVRHSPIAFDNGFGGMTRVMLRKFGTVVNNVLCTEIQDAPIKNWKGSREEFSVLKHSGKLEPGKVIAHQKKRYHCSSCTLGCGGELDLSGKTRFPLYKTHKPEYETCASFGSIILNSDLDAIFMINDMLNRAGMDTISAGSTVAFAMECFEKGIISTADTGGIDLTWGNIDAVIEVLKKMIARDGIGDVLADGSAKAAERIGKGSEEFAIHAGGQDLPMHDGRLDPGFAVAYIMEPTPGRHCTTSYLYYELFKLDKIFKGLPSTPMAKLKSSWLSTKNKEVLLVNPSIYIQIVNGAGVCLFAMQCGPKYPLIDYLNAATGWDKKPEEYLEVGNRIQQLRQFFNVKHGKIPTRDFNLPKRVIGDPALKSGPLKGVRIPIEELVKNYTKAMGWDEMGRPLPETLKALGIDEINKETEKIAQ